MSTPDPDHGADAMTAAPVTMLALVHEAADLERPPQPGDLTAEHEVSSLGATARLASMGAGLVVGVFAAATALVPFTLLAGDVLATIVAVVSGAVVVVLLRRVAGRLDVRLVLTVGALPPLLVVVLPPPGADHLAGRLLMIAVGVLLVHLAALAWRKVRQARTEVMAWNRAYARLAADPRRAVSAHPAMLREPVGAAHRFTGTVRYVDEAGRSRTVPLTSALGLQLLYSDEQEARDDSPCVVWHSADHGVVLTVVLMDSAAV